MRKPKKPRFRFEQKLGPQFVKDGGILLQRAQVVGHGGMVMSLNKYGDHRDSKISRCHIWAPEPPVPKPDKNRMRSPTKWNAQFYDFSGVVEGCLFEGLIQEHDVYVREIDDTDIRECYFDSPGSQAVQSLYRSSESKRKVRKGARIRIEDCVSWQAGSPVYGERPAFAFTGQHSDSGFEVIAPIMYCKTPYWFNAKAPSAGPVDKDHKYAARAFGAILSKERGHTLLDGGPPRKRSVIEYWNPYRPVVQIEKPRGPVVIRRLNFTRGGKLMLLNVGNTPITIEKCKGPVEIWRKDGGNAGRKIGPISAGFSQ